MRCSVRVVRVIAIGGILCWAESVGFAQPAEPGVSAQNAQQSPPAEASSQPIALVAARRAVEEAQFSAALESLAKALKEGRAEPAHLIEIYRLVGESSVAIGNSSEAIEAFQRLLILAPDVTLGEFVSPKITAVLDQARDRLAGAKLTSHHTVDSESRRLIVAITSNPLGMAQEVRMQRPGADGRLMASAESGEVVIDLPADVGQEVQLALLDVHGNVLKSWMATDLPMARPRALEVAGIESSPSASGGTDQALWSKWWVYAGAGAAFAGVGTFFAIRSKSAQGDLDKAIANPGNYFSSDAKAFEELAQSRATWANLSFALAAVAGVTSGYMYWRGQKLETRVELDQSGPAESATLLIGGNF